MATAKITEPFIAGSLGRIVEILAENGEKYTVRFEGTNTRFHIPKNAVELM